MIKWHQNKLHIYLLWHHSMADCVWLIKTKMVVRSKIWYARYIPNSLTQTCIDINTKMETLSFLIIIFIISHIVQVVFVFYLQAVYTMNLNLVKMCNISSGYSIFVWDLSNFSMVTWSVWYIFYVISSQQLTWFDMDGNFWEWIQQRKCDVWWWT